MDWGKAKKAAATAGKATAAGLVGIMASCGEPDQAALEQRAAEMAKPLVEQYAQIEQVPYDRLVQKIQVYGDTTAHVNVYLDKYYETSILVDFRTDSAKYRVH